MKITYFDTRYKIMNEPSVGQVSVLMEKQIRNTQIYQSKSAHCKEHLAAPLLPDDLKYCGQE